MAMIAQGIFAEEEKFELHEGEIVSLVQESSRHFLVKNRLSRVLHQMVPSQLLTVTDSTLYLSETTFVEPDIYIMPDTETGP